MLWRFLKNRYSIHIFILDHMNIEHWINSNFRLHQKTFYTDFHLTDLFSIQTCLSNRPNMKIRQTFSICYLNMEQMWMLLIRMGGRQYLPQLSLVSSFFELKRNWIKILNNWIEWLIFTGSVARTEKLMKNKADVNIADIRGETPLHYAIYAGKFEKNQKTLVLIVIWLMIQHLSVKIWLCGVLT